MEAILNFGLARYNEKLSVYVIQLFHFLRCLVLNSCDVNLHNRERPVVLPEESESWIFEKRLPLKNV
jgi:hypothetical protein